MGFQANSLMAQGGMNTAIQTYVLVILDRARKPVNINRSR